MINRIDYPDFLNEYIMYLKVVLGHSERTVNEYFLDIRMFLRYIKMVKFNLHDDLDTISIKDFEVKWLKEITLNDIYEFEYFLSTDRKNNNPARSRKTSALKGFFKYLHKRANLIDKNPMADVELPSLKKTVPKYLTLEESIRMLSSVKSTNPTRDYCIITLFLNCGMRLSELVGLNKSDINLSERTMRLLGKGNKERLIYINDACVEAIEEYLKTRPNVSSETKALFLSRLKKRISKRRVQQVVDAALFNANLDDRGFSTHKLRHTAATLMYQHGGVDTLILKEILGHENISTTQIYTHVNDNQMRQAMNSSPLSNFGSLNNHTMDFDNSLQKVEPDAEIKAEDMKTPDLYNDNKIKK